MGLTEADRRALRDDGYLLIPGAVPPEHVRAALRLVNGSLGEQGLPRERLPEMRARTYCPELTESPELLALYGSGLADTAEKAIGKARVVPPSRAQIALRFPQAQLRPSTPHIDGMYTPDNGVPQGTLSHFTALGGVFLSDVEDETSGNFTVWPGSHELMASHVRQHGVASLNQGFPTFSLPPPLPLRIRAGDALLAHYALAHAAGPNLGPHVRYAVFFRLFHVDHARWGERCLTDPWGEWEGMTR